MLAKYLIAIHLHFFSFAAPKSFLTFEHILSDFINFWLSCYF